jgi:Eukaryotic aspartyl protease
LHNRIPDTITDGQGNFAFPCNTTTALDLVFGGTSFTISPKDYVGAALTGTNGDLCTSNIVGQQIGSETQWLVGDVYLKNVYTVFDYDNNQVGFGAKPTVGNAQKQPNVNTGLVAAVSDAGTKRVGRGVLWGVGVAVVGLLLV